MIIQGRGGATLASVLRGSVRTGPVKIYPNQAGPGFMEENKNNMAPVNPIGFKSSRSGSSSL